jgi:glycosyltransferase involved in cell wall biosynthesis
MKVLVLVPQYPPAVGGAELQAQRLARELVNLGVQVSVLTQVHRGTQSLDDDKGVRVIRALAGLQIGPLWGLTFMRSTWRCLERLSDRWDIVHNQQVGLHSVVAVDVAARLGKRSLLRFACAGEGGDLERLKGRRFGQRLLGSLRRADRFVALTGEGGDEIVRFGFPADRVRTIPNGVDSAIYTAVDLTPPSPSEPLRLLFVGRLTRQKGLDILLTALSGIRDRLRFHLRIIGEGNENAALVSLAAKLKIRQAVEFCGRRADVIHDYSWCELLVLPSRYEGMPNVVLEAMSCARPVLGTSVGGIADLVLDGVNGWLVERENVAALADAIVRIAANRGALAALGAEARRLVQSRYSVQRIASLYVREYGQLLSMRRS